MFPLMCGIEPSADIFRGGWSSCPGTAAFSMSQPVIFVRGAVEAVKCSLNLHLLFNKPNVLHIGYMQQKRKVNNEFNFFFLSCIMVS